MQLISLVNHVQNSQLCSELEKRTNREVRLTLNGSSRVANTIILSALAKKKKKALIIIVPSFEDVGRWYSILNLSGWEKTYIYPTSESSPYDSLNQSSEITWGQLQVISELTTLSFNSQICIITTERALQPHLPPPEYLTNSCLKLKQGEEYELEEISQKLSTLDYRRINTVDQEGTWARRGDIIDIYPVNYDLPVRLEFFGNQLEIIKEFDPSTQRSQDNINSVNITPTSINSLIADKIRLIENEKKKQFLNEEDFDLLEEGNTPEGIKRFIQLAWNNPSSIIDYLPLESFVVIDEKNQCIAHSNHWITGIQENIKLKKSIKSKDYNMDIFGKLYIDLQEILPKVYNFDGLDITSLGTVDSNLNYYDIKNSYIDILPNQFGKASQIINNYVKEKTSVFIFSAQPSRAISLLEEHECIAYFVSNYRDISGIEALLKDNTPVSIKCSHEADLEGVYMPSFKLAIITDRELFGQQNLVNNSYIRRRKKSSSKSIDPYKLHPGDYVVHKNHGIGKFNKIEKITVNNETRDYLVVNYEDGILRVAADQLNSLGRYRSSTSNPPKINKMGGKVWINLKDRAKKNIKKVAIDLLKLYAEREQKTGYSFPSDGPWQNELEESFPYQPTKDQLKAVNEVKRDMEKERPMDRLICGDVGYGKTEVAIRAIFKAITSGKQIALLAPTTILSQQHWRTITDRFAPYPIKVSLLNRFKTNTERKNILEQLKTGNIDALVGTHQLLNKNTIFKELGLLVIDEEQRFGVNQKERIKELKKSVDVLTLSATPIPRTLYMSLSGVREMSLITTPPPLRRAIKTNLVKMDEEVIRSAISQELDRGGQIFYVVPRVEGIDKVAIKLATMLPNLKLIVAHGQMTEGELENSMIAFNAGEADLMLCTTIIESGLDIPRVNTILIEDAHRFGLSQLYQLRGRVGRSGVQAYAWLFYPDSTKLTQAARERLRAIQEFSSLGSGYQLSIRDMEIRGVGNILGVEQSGQMEVIGFDLYMELLQEAMAEIKGQDIPEVDETQIDLSITAFIPSDYIVDNDEKISAYRSASQCNTSKELAELALIWVDRYGTLPKAVETLIQIMNLKIRAKNCGFSRIKNEKPNISLETKMDEPAFRILRQGLPKHLHSRLIYIKGDYCSKVIARGLGIYDNEKLVDTLIKWLDMMNSQLVEVKNNSD